MASGGAVERVGGQGVGEEGEEEEKVRLPYLARAGVQRGGLATVTDGGGGGVCEAAVLQGWGGGARDGVACGGGCRREERLFIGEMRRWGGGTRRWRSVPAGEHRGAPLMALQPLARVATRRRCLLGGRCGEAGDGTCRAGGAVLA